MPTPIDDRVNDLLAAITAYYRDHKLLAEGAIVDAELLRDLIEIHLEAMVKDLLKRPAK